MSLETAEHLNTNTLIGFTSRRGKAWHYREELQGAESNHYTDAVPVADVRRRLFGWTPESRRVAVEFPATFETMTHLDDKGLPVRWVYQKDLQAITRDDARLGLFKPGYKIHGYDEWLVGNVEKILGEGLSISSAGLLKGGAVAWVEVSVPETITTPSGIAFRPNLLAATSLDGSLSTTYKRTVQLTVCDNTMAVALGERGQTVKIRHSSKSLDRIADVREALAMVHLIAEEATASLELAATTPVTDEQMKLVIKQVWPLVEDASKRATTTNAQRVGDVWGLWTGDERVAPWRGTAFGVVQAFNTYRHHLQGGLPKGADDAARGERNQWRAVTGETEKEDAAIAAALQLVLA